MTCNLALAAALVFAPDAAVAPVSDPSAVVAAAVPASLANEPMFAALISESQRLKQIVDGWISSSVAEDANFLQSPAFSRFKTEAEALARADMNGHLTLKERGTDGDLTCILRGISEDMPKRVANVETAPLGADRAQALEELAYLLNDNVEVIQAPPVAP